MTGPLITLGGLDLFGTDAAGVEWVVEKNGLDWSGSAGSTVSPVQRARGNGAWSGRGYLKPRSYSLSGTIIGPTRAAVEDALDRLSAAASIDDTVLSVTEELRTRWTTVRRDDEIVPKWLNDRTAQFSTGLVAPDPRQFGAAITVATALPSTTGGLSVPFSVPFSIPAVTVTGQVSLTNLGKIAGPVRLRIDGPVTAPVVTHVSSGRSLRFASSLTLAAGEFVTVDMERQQVLAQGQETASRAKWVTTAEWSSFEPGVNVWAFTAGTFTPGARLTVEAVPSWA